MSATAAELPRRVLLLIDRLQLGGPGRMVVAQATGLRARGVDARVAHLGLGDWQPLAAELRASGIPTLRVDLPSLLNPRPYLRLAAYLRRQRIDLLHTHNRYAHLVGRVGAALARRPVVSTVHNLVETDLTWRDRLRRQLDYWTARHLCALVITVAEAQREAYVRAARVPADRVETHRNGVDTDRFRPDPRARASLRAALALPDQSPLFVTVAVLRPGKGIEHLLEAAALLRARAPDARFAVVGDGPRRADLEARAAALGLNEVVTFLGTRADVPALLAASDVYVHPSLFEALPTSILEAMAVGRAVVATNVGGVPEIVGDGQTGLLVPPACPEALAAALARLLNGRPRASLGAAGRAWVEAHASRGVWLDRLECAYRRVAGRRG